ncbi:hypothetical protein KAR91_53610 [Candidatus Pacearchaeota archaeon]|nr:hypothetical protein [Candidatus Pacearchaeota archaeon]
MKKEIKPSRDYRMASGMIVKTKNSKQSWANGNKDKPEILHMQRHHAFWMECFDEKYVAIAKQVDRVDAKTWLKQGGFELPEVLR